MVDSNGVVRIGELYLYKLDEIQYLIKSTSKKRIPKKTILGFAIDQLKNCPACQKKFKAWVSNYKSERK